MECQLAWFLVPTSYKPETETILSHTAIEEGKIRRNEKFVHLEATSSAMTNATNYVFQHIGRSKN